MKWFVVVALLAGCAAPTQETGTAHSMAPVGSAQHEWLQQLVGEWAGKSQAVMAPDAEPMVMEFTESVRSVGGLWVVCEGSATMEGMPVTTLMTLGYDPAEERFVGLWIDTMQTHMWTYVGALDESKRVLTLSTEGPSWEDPTKSCKFRDAIEIKGPDHKVLTSSIQGDDGQWTTFMTAEYRRQK